jgi:hypothetical protein
MIIIFYGRRIKMNKTEDVKIFTKQTEQVLETGTSSVSLVKNSKGVNIGVKVYDTKPLDAERLAVKIFDRLDKKYD